MSTGVGEEKPGSQRLALLLAMAMFVLVVDTSLMNVSISAVADDLGTDARPLALQAALLIPILAGLAGLLNSFRMVRLPDPLPSSIAVHG